MKKKSKESKLPKKDTGKVLHGESPQPRDYLYGLSWRLGEAARLVGGKKKLAQMSGISAVQLFRYIKMKNVPNVKAIVDVAKAAKVNPTWLITGEGSWSTEDSDRLKQAGRNLAQLEDLGWHAHRIAKQAGLAEREIVGFINGSIQPSVEKLVQISQATPISVDFMLTGMFLHKKDLSESLPAYSEATRNPYKPEVLAGFVHIKSFAGEPDEKASSRYPFLFHQEYLGKFLGLPPGKIYAARVNDDAMEPTLKNGDYVLADLTHSGKFSGDGLYMLSDRGTPTFRRVQLLFNNDVLLRFDNHDYKEVKCKLADLNNDKPLNIVGKVVWYGHKVN